MIAAQPSGTAQRARVVSSAIDALHPAIRQLHFGQESLRAEGWFTVRRGGGLLSQIIGAVLRFPSEGRGVGLSLNVERGTGREMWRRSFGARRVDAAFSVDGDRGVERFGPLELRYDVRVERGSLRLTCAGAVLRLGALRVVLPRWLAPRVRSRTWFNSADCRVHVSVVVMAPVARLLLAYRGWVMEV